MTNIKLSKRLQSIADMVEPNSITADIGCDHALLDIYLIKSKKVKKSVASDINIGALNQAKKNILRYELEDSISARLGDGLKTINKEDNINTIILSGLGDQKIINILSEYELNKIDTIIIQSNVGVKNIRQSVTKLGYYINDEKLVKENKIIYTIIKFKKGQSNYSKKDYLFGPVLLKSKDELFKEDINNKITKNNLILKKIPNKKIIKKIKLINYIRKLKKEI